MPLGVLGCDPHDGLDHYPARIAIQHLSAADFAEVLRSPFAPDELAGAEGAAVVVDDADLLAEDETIGAALRGLPCVVVALTPGAAPAFADVAVPADSPALDDILATIDTNPQAATALALLLRDSERRDIPDGLVAESAVYSTLQAGPEFAAWRASHAVRHRAGDDAARVRSVRDGERLLVTLTRPERHNALDARMRDELVVALAVAEADPSISSVELRGKGPSFCSGGDLDEFGTLPDPATAHLIRLTRSLGRVLASLSDRVVVHVHGTCRGSGIELPAFASRVVADPATTFGLPEVRLGLIPGAGGTVSLPRRIGRHRTALLALTAGPIDAATALAWGLVDELS